jgi:hypothetical protein
MHKLNSLQKKPIMIRMVSVIFLLLSVNMIHAQKVVPPAQESSVSLEIEGNIKISNGTQGAGKMLTSDENGLASWTAPNTNLLNFRFTLPNGSGSESSSNFWTRVGAFVYRGTETDGSIGQALALLYSTNGNTYYRLRIFDVTESKIIATSLPSNLGINPNPEIVDLGLLSNLPLLPSVFEIQILATDVTGTTGIAGRQAIGIHSIQLYR